MPGSDLQIACTCVAACGDLTVGNLKSAIVTNVDSVPSLAGKTITGGRLNVYKAVASCSGSVTPDFALSVSPASQTVSTSGSVAYTVTKTPTGGYTGSPALSVSGLPGGASAAIGGWSSNTATVTVTTNGAAPGTYALTFTGTDGSLVHTATAALVVQSTTPAYALSLSSSSLIVKRGSSGRLTVTVTGSGGFSGTVALAAAGMSSGVTASFSPASVTGSGTSTLTMAAVKSATRGTSTVTVTGTSSGFSPQSKTFTLTIR